MLGVTFSFDYDSPVFYLASCVLGASWLLGWLLGGNPADLERQAGPAGPVAHSGTAMPAGSAGPAESAAPAGSSARRSRLAPRRLTAVLAGVISGAVLAAGCGIGAVILGGLPVVGPAIRSVISPVGPSLFVPVLITAAIVGAAEELMFRGAVYSWFSRRPVLWSTLIYTAVTVATGNPALVIAAALLGAVTAGLRRWSSGLAAPLLCHVTWSVLLLAVLPRILDL